MLRYQRQENPLGGNVMSASLVNETQAEIRMGATRKPNTITKRTGWIICFAPRIAGSVALCNVAQAGYADVECRAEHGDDDDDR
jgi:hypothetical protein